MTPDDPNAGPPQEQLPLPDETGAAGESAPSEEALLVESADSEIAPSAATLLIESADAEAEAAQAEVVHRASRLSSILESLLFVADRPLTSAEIAILVGEPQPAVIEGALTMLASEWLPRGVHLHAVAGAWQFRSNPENAVWVQRLLAHKPVRLTRSQLETLAIIAYRQPITRPEIDDIRGVDTGGTLKTLLDRTLIRILGKKEEPGRPLLYGTTKEFLEFFNLRDLRELPTLREFQELSDEHRAQVEALEKAAPPGSIEREPTLAPTTLPPLQRVDVSDDHIEDDLNAVDALINAAEGKARSAAEALGGEGSPLSSGTSPMPGARPVGKPGPNAAEDSSEEPSDEPSGEYEEPSG